MSDATRAVKEAASRVDSLVIAYDDYVARVENDEVAVETTALLDAQAKRIIARYEKARRELGVAFDQLKIENDQIWRDAIEDQGTQFDRMIEQNDEIIVLLNRIADKKGRK